MGSARDPWAQGQTSTDRKAQDQPWSTDANGGASLTMVTTVDLSAICRGRALPTTNLDGTLANGVGWVPANLAITPFGTLAQPNPFGSVGDLRLIPDLATRIRLSGAPSRDGIDVVLGNLEQPDGTPWDCCPRTFLQSALRDLEVEAGLTIRAAFEHEFVECVPQSAMLEHPFSLQALLAGEPLGSLLVQTLVDAGLRPENWLPEFGERQWEITLEPADGLIAADRAIMVRETVRHLARELGRRVTFSPVTTGTGATSGVHIHLSLWHRDGMPATFDAGRPAHLSSEAGSFAAGVLRHAPALLALTAPSAVSYARLQPGHWSVGRAALVERDREALLRLPAIVELAGQNRAAQFNLEYRAADATSNPWIALGALVRAGLEGLRSRLPSPITGASDVSSAQLEGSQLQLPHSLGEALHALEEDSIAASWLSNDLLSTYLSVKREEHRMVEDLDDSERFSKYAEAY